MLSSRPFVPFIVKVAGNWEFVVRGPELVMCDVAGRAMTLADEDGTHEIDMMLVAVMEHLKSPADLPENRPQA